MSLRVRSLTELHGLTNGRPLPRANKYGAKRVSGATRADGKSFDSVAEESRYDVLRLKERAGEIVKGSIRTQVRYRLEVNGVHICDYVADAVYRLASAPEVDVVEDTKGVRTPVYRLKKKLMAAVYGIEIQEIGGQRTSRRPPKARLLTKKARTR